MLGKTREKQLVIQLTAITAYLFFNVNENSPNLSWYSNGPSMYISVFDTVFDISNILMF